MGPQPARADRPSGTPDQPVAAALTVDEAGFTRWRHTTCVPSQADGAQRVRSLLAHFVPLLGAASMLAEER